MRRKELIFRNMLSKQTIILVSIFFLSFLNFLFIVWFFLDHQHLPPPFFYIANDTFMDFYNTLYWSGQDGIYDVWRSVYPPLNFLFLKVYQLLFIENVSDAIDGFSIRALNADNIIPLFIMYVISIAVSVLISYKNFVNWKCKLIIFATILFSPAFLIALERGNLIILSVPVLSWYIFSSNQINRSIALAFLVNIKPYFIVLYIFQLANRKSNEQSKDFLFLAPFFSLILFLITGLLLNQKFYLMPINIFGFAASKTLLAPAEALSFSNTIISFGYFRGLVTEIGIPPIFGHLTKLIVLIYLVKSLVIIYKEKLNFDDLNIFSIIFLTNYSTSTGGYGLLFYIPILSLLYKQRKWVIFFIIIIFMYVGLWDLIPIYYFSYGSISSYLSGSIVEIDTYISLGSIIRPIANFILLLLFFKILRKRYQYASIKH